jgi:hypothetical protein
MLTLCNRTVGYEMLHAESIALSLYGAAGNLGPAPALPSTKMALA